MKIEQIYTECLAQGAYFIWDKNEAIVIDPLREIDPYIAKAKKEGVKIKYILETHFHADFVSGHIDLAKATGATIIFGPNNFKIGYEIKTIKDGEILQLGEITIEAIHTPGHTLESTCYLLKDNKGKQIALFTGDTLFIGDVGRPDLLQGFDEGLTQEKLAGILYESLQNKIMPLDDKLIVYPAHGAGSFCGKNLSKETYDTLGNQKKSNYALNTELTKEQFIKEITTGLMPPPGYFVENVKLNIYGYKSIQEIIKKGTKAFSLEEFENIINKADILILDTRNQNDFVKGHIPNSIFIGLNGQFALFVGTLIKNINQKILIIADKGKEEETVIRLSRVGYDNSIGFLEGGFDTWKNANKEFNTIETISANEAFKRVENKEGVFLDVRSEAENKKANIENELNLPLEYINENMDKIDSKVKYFTHCAGGYRSVIFISILKARGFNGFVNIEGGFNKIKELKSCNIVQNACTL